MMAKVKIFTPESELEILISIYDAFYLKKVLCSRLWSLNITKNNQGSLKKWVISDLGQEMGKINVGLDVHFTRLNRSPLAPVYLALLEDIGQKGQRASKAGSAVKECSPKNGIMMLQCTSQVLVESEVAILPPARSVGCSQFIPEYSSGNCFQCKGTSPNYASFQESALPKLGCLERVIPATKKVPLDWLSYIYIVV